MRAKPSLLGLASTDQLRRTTYWSLRLFVDLTF